MNQLDRANDDEPDVDGLEAPRDRTLGEEVKNSIQRAIDDELCSSQCPDGNCCCSEESRRINSFFA